MKKNTLISISCLLCMLTTLSAQVINVPADSSTIQSAINGASDGDTVLVAEGTYYENINFLGKAITVASHFILDSLNSHIENTVIDGSQPTNPDSASVVLMVSGEDTTSVLCGFTITGGKGTWIYNTDVNQYQIGGYGIFTRNSGGKIESNVIEQNNPEDPGGNVFGLYGFGIAAWLTGNDNLIIRNNVIRNNNYTGDTRGIGAGIVLLDGRILVEGNVISGNSSSNKVEAVGGGICYWHTENDTEGLTKLTIRNNIFADNEVSVTSQQSSGGAIFMRTFFLPTDIQIYNNLIDHNTAHNGRGGAIEMWEADPVIYNNTLVNNMAIKGKQIGTRYSSKPLLFNNILWSDTGDGISEINNQEQGSVTAEYCDIKGGWIGEGNIDADPLFTGGTFELSEGSPCIGAGTDSILVDDLWYYAPELDFSSTDRPFATIDHRVDLGAIESSFSYPVTYDSESIINVPGEVATIQEAIDAAETGDTVLVAPLKYMENINFKGKAITVAGEFLMDGDTTHISRTIIDGSNATNPDSASTVQICNGEDENSKLIGLKITGGTGTEYTLSDRYGMAGGGIQIFQSGATIASNIIEHNEIINDTYDTQLDLVGAGIGAYQAKAVIIKDNTIRNNKILSGFGGNGAGIIFLGKDILIDNNHIYGNRVDSRWAVGGAICYASGEAGEKAVISNNSIHDNGLYLVANISNRTSGGGIWMETYDGTETVEVFNNLIYNNHTAKYGGGISSRAGANFLIYNNTIVDNTAGLGGKNLSLETNGNLAAEFTMFNNIIYNSDGSSDNIRIFSGAKANLFQNLITGTKVAGNINAGPNFKPGTFDLDEGSPCIGAGVDGLDFAEQWYAAPETDFSSNTRPDPVDVLVDIGAIESPYENSPPILTVDPGIARYDEPVSVTSTEDGNIFIVLDNSYDNIADVRANFLQDSVEVKSGVATDITIDDTENQHYWLYAIDNLEKLSEPVSVEIFGVGMDQTSQEYFSIYPNPSFGNITLLLKKADNYSVEIISSAGQLIQNLNFSGNSRLIDLTDYPEGLYFILVRSDEFVWTEKILKL